MRTLASAIVRLPLATALFTGEQVVRLFRDGEQGERDVRVRLYRVTQSLQDELGDVLWAAFSIGDALQRSAIDRLCELADGRRWEVMLVQLRNSVNVFNLVKNSRTILGTPQDGAFPLRQLIADAYALGEYPAVWAIEGLGHDLADFVRACDSAVVALLQGDAIAELPCGSLTMLNAGMGLSFAKFLLKDATPDDDASGFARLTRHFLTLVRTNASPGYTGAALESLGLVARTWYPQIVNRLDAALGDADPDAREFFWHGVGRALYFNPLYIVPGVASPWRAIDREPPDAVARLNMKAGLAWATTLVNMRQPAILELLLRDRGQALTADDAFADGAASALAMALDVNPGNAVIASLIASVAPVDDASVAAMWESLIVRPGRFARAAQPLLANAGLTGELFRYHTFPEWFDAVAGVSSPGARHELTH